MKDLDSTKLISALRGVNAHFHLHKEDDKKFRNQFYTLKDAIVKLMLTQKDELGVKYSLEGSMIDGGGNRYTLVYFSTENTGAFIHVPLKVCPEVLCYTSEYQIYKPNKDGYMKLDITSEQFKEDYTYLEHVYQDCIFKKKLDALKDWEILAYLKSSAGKVGVRACLKQLEPTMYFETKKRGRFLYKLDMSVIRKAISTIQSFNYVDIYRYLTSNSIIKPVRV